MVTIHKISEGLFMDSFDLIALHCAMECYALAYHINKVTGFKLIRAEGDLEIATSSYPFYEWKDSSKDQEWYLIKNVVTVEEVGDNQGLFQDSMTTTLHYLLEERKEINYLLKLSPGNSNEITKALEIIRTVPSISMAYQMDVETLKSKRNLIF